MTIPASPSSRPSICHVGAARAAALFLAFVSFSVGGLFVIYPWINSTVSDLPFFLSTGKYICEQGIPYTNPFAVDEGLGIVVQQWLWDVAVFKLHELGGYNLVAALGIALAACACALCLPVWQSVSGGEAVGKTQALPAGAAVACCLLFSLPWARGRRRAQESWGGGAPPLVLAALSAAAMPLNPYGLDGMLYVFRSAGAASYAGAILEMQGPLSSGDGMGRGTPAASRRAARRRWPSALRALVEGRRRRGSTSPRSRSRRRS